MDTFERRGTEKVKERKQMTKVEGQTGRKDKSERKKEIKNGRKG